MVHQLSGGSHRALKLDAASLTRGNRFQSGHVNPTWPSTEIDTSIITDPSCGVVSADYSEVRKGPCNRRASVCLCVLSRNSTTASVSSFQPSSPRTPVHEGSLVRPLLLRGRFWAQPQRDVCRSHRLADHPHQVVAQRPEVGLVAQPG